MHFPIRCFSCGKIIGNKWEKYIELIEKVSPKEALDQLGIERYCCRRMFISHVDLVDDVIPYNPMK